MGIRNVGEEGKRVSHILQYATRLARGRIGYLDYMALQTDIVQAYS